jgi:hypothetical protein
MIHTTERRADDLWRAEMQEKIERMERELRENTIITRELRDIMVTVKSGSRMLGWLGAAIKWLSGVVAAGLALWAMFGHNAPK